MRMAAPLFGLLLVGSVLAGEINWVKDYDTAAQQAAKSGKIIMADFFTDWCIWCKRLDKTTYTDEKVVGLADKLVSVKINAEREGRSLAQSHGVTGFPTILFLNAKGAVVGRIDGFLPPDAFAEQVSAILAKADGTAAAAQEQSADKPAPAKAPAESVPVAEGEGAELGWAKSYDEALKAAKDKVVMIDFYTDWCGWCKKLDKDTYSNADVVKFLDQKIVPLKLNAEKEGAELAKKHGVRGYPTILFVSGTGEVVGRIGGYMQPDPFLKEVKQILQTADELPKIQEALKANPSDGPANARFVKVAMMRGDLEAAELALGKAELGGVTGDAMAEAYNAVGDGYQSKSPTSREMAAARAEFVENMSKAIGFFSKGAKNAETTEIKAYSQASLVVCHQALARTIADDLNNMKDLPEQYKDLVKRVLEN